MAYTDDVVKHYYCLESENLFPHPLRISHRTELEVTSNNAPFTSLLRLLHALVTANSRLRPPLGQMNPLRRLDFFFPFSDLEQSPEVEKGLLSILRDVCFINCLFRLQRPTQKQACFDMYVCTMNTADVQKEQKQHLTPNSCSNTRQKGHTFHLF